ncbi:MAG: helix-turn-helix domain-containing protein [Rhodanobacter sp.]
MDTGKEQRSLVVSIGDACKALGIGRTCFYQMLLGEKIRVIKIGNRTLVPQSELERIASGRPIDESTVLVHYLDNGATAGVTHKRFGRETDDAR